MELILTGANVHVSGPATVILPDYMVRMDPAAVRSRVAAVGDAGLLRLIIAAGLHPSGDVLFMTADGTLHELAARHVRLPPWATVAPSHVGIDILLTPNAWPDVTDMHELDGSGYVIDADWALERSRTLVCAEVSGSTVTFVDDEG